MLYSRILAFVALAAIAHSAPTLPAKDPDCGHTHTRGPLQLTFEVMSGSDLSSARRSLRLSRLIASDGVMMVYVSVTHPTHVDLPCYLHLLFCCAGHAAFLIGGVRIRGQCGPLEPTIEKPLPGVIGTPSSDHGVGPEQIVRMSNPLTSSAFAPGLR